MADGSFSPGLGGRRTFLVTGQDEADLLLRVLAPFAVQGARIVAANLTVEAGQAAIRIEVAGMDMGRAQHLAERLRAMPAVAGVGLGWKAEAVLAL